MFQTTNQLKYGYPPKSLSFVRFPESTLHFGFSPVLGHLHMVRLRKHHGQHIRGLRLKAMEMIPQIQFLFQRLHSEVMIKFIPD